MEGQQWYCFNVLQKADGAIDPENSKYEIDDGEMRFGLIESAFILGNLPASSLFKIKGDNYTIIYCANRRDSDDDVLAYFFCTISGHGCSGVKFEEVFNG